MNFAHAVFDNAFDAGLCRAAASAWPASDWSGWHAVYRAEHQKKLACNHWQTIPLSCRDLLRQMLFLDVGSLGFGHLVPDMSLWGGGMHALCRDGVLGLHLDASEHAQVGLRRVLNGILFLNESWREEWGGSLELWSADRTRQLVTIAPAFNRLVLFATNDTTWHGIPQPLMCPEGVQRMTLALWWYAADAPQESKRQRAHFAAPESQ